MDRRVLDKVELVPPGAEVREGATRDANIHTPSGRSRLENKSHCERISSLFARNRREVRDGHDCTADGPCAYADAFDAKFWRQAVDDFTGSTFAIGQQHEHTTVREEPEVAMVGDKVLGL